MIPQLVSWGYYSLLYEQVSKEEFKQAERLAEREIQKVIGPIRFATITDTDFGYVQLQDCICMVINKMAENKRSGNGKGLSSVSNDGYSETYAIQTQEQMMEELHRFIRMQLSGTGLVGAY